MASYRHQTARNTQIQEHQNKPTIPAHTPKGTTIEEPNRHRRARRLWGSIDEDEGTGSGKKHENQVPACLNAPELSGRINDEVTVGVECSNWVVTGSVDVRSGAKLIVVPGTTLTFASGAGLTISEGILDAEGAEGLPIVFTGAEDTPGYWHGVSFSNANSQHNRLSHVTIEYAGGQTYGGGLAVSGSASKPSRVVVDNSVFRHNKGFGLTLTGNAVLSSFENNTLTDNAQGAAWVDIGNVGQLTADSNDYTGNEKERVVVSGGTLSSESTLEDLGVPFQSGDITIQGGGKLTVGANTTVTFESGAEVHCKNEGRLVAEGTEKKPIIFTGLEPTRGYWKGVVIGSCASSENVLDHVTVEYAGVKATYATQPANVMLTDKTSRLRISNSTLRKSLGYGLHIRHPNSNVAEVSSSTLTDNTLGAAHVHAANVHNLLATSTYVGNAEGRDFVHTWGDMAGSVTWKALDVPYYTHDTIKVPAGAHLTIEPNTTLLFGSKAALEVKGELTAVGNTNEPITFTKMEGDGRWKGLYFGDTEKDNKVEFAKISQAGQQKFTYASAKGGLSANKSKVSIAHSTFSDNDGYGVTIRDSTVTGCESATFEGNEAGGWTTQGNVDIDCPL